MSSIVKLQAQIEKPVTIDGEDYTVPLKWQIPGKPSFYKISYPLTEKEIHRLDTLSKNEKQLIKNAVNPIAIGIVRNLKSSINFNLKSIPIPYKGEISIAGGRLARVSEDTVVFTAEFRSEKADEMRLYFESGFLPVGVKVNLFGKGDYAFTQQALSGEIEKEGFYTTTTFSDYVIVQVVIPVYKTEPNVHFSISKISHIENKDIPGYNSRPTADCYRDANCITPVFFPHIESFQRAVTALYFISNNQLIFWCSGSLINDRRTTDFQPFVLTANHCFSTQADISTIEARFSYWSSTCNSSQSNTNLFITNGANLIATNSQSDFAMILLREKPGGNRTYLGWTTATVPNGSILRSVHHPEGTFQKYSRHENITSPSYSCTGASTSHFLYTNTLNGQTNGGSSGGAIVNEDGHIVGQLLGACPATSSYDLCEYGTYRNVWGKFSSSYNNNNLQYWLNNGATVKGSITPSSLNFGTVSVGQSVNKDVIIDNIGLKTENLNFETGPATISGSGASQFSISGNNEIYLSPGRQKALQVIFNPSFPGLYSAILRIPHNANNIGASPRQININGCAAPAQPGSIYGPGIVSKFLQYSYNITPVPGATSYTWKFNGNTLICNSTSCLFTPPGDGVLSVSANVSCATSLPVDMLIQVKEGIRIFPNPVVDEMIIEYGGNISLINFEICNSLGQIVFSNSMINRTTVKTDFFPPGVYFIKFSREGEKVEVKKIIKSGH